MTKPPPPTEWTTLGSHPLRLLLRIRRRDIHIHRSERLRSNKLALLHRHVGRRAIQQNRPSPRIHPQYLRDGEMGQRAHWARGQTVESNRGLSE